MKASTIGMIEFGDPEVGGAHLRVVGVAGCWAPPDFLGLHPVALDCSVMFTAVRENATLAQQQCRVFHQETQGPTVCMRVCETIHRVDSRGRQRLRIYLISLGCSGMGPYCREQSQSAWVTTRTRLLSGTCCTTNILSQSESSVRDRDSDAHT